MQNHSMSSSEQKNPESGGETSQGFCRLRIGGAILSGVLGILSFPVFGRPYQLDLLVFFVLLPLMLVAQGVGRKRGFALGGICGMTFVGVSFFWVCHTINEFTGIGTLLSFLVYLLWVAYEALPWAVLGLPPRWYKDPAYRSRVVREPRTVLQEFGTTIPDSTKVQVWDSSAEVRYMVLPAMPRSWAGRAHDVLASKVSRDSMIGVQVLLD